MWMSWMVVAARKKYSESWVSSSFFRVLYLSLSLSLGLHISHSFSLPPSLPIPPNPLSDVKYPTLYAASNATPFNCIQRAHQNSLETFPGVMLLLVLGAAVNPRRAALAGLGWGVARVVYFLGYATGNPEGRLPGVALSYAALLALMHLVASTGSHLLRGK